MSREFRRGPDGRPHVKCPRCGSLERHRFLSLLLGVLAPELRDLDTVVEIGPSRQSTVLIDQLGARRRIGLDFGYDGREVDALACLTRLPLRDASVDLLVCYHVLEHVPDDAAAMHEIARVLSPRGIALLQVPIRMGVLTEEDPEAPPEERLRRFGQVDHVRWYGDDFDSRLSAAGLSSVRVTPPALLGEAAVEWFHLMPHEMVWVARPGKEVAAPDARGRSRIGSHRCLRRPADRPRADAREGRPGTRPRRPAGRPARRPAGAAGGRASAPQRRGGHPPPARRAPVMGLPAWLTGSI